MKKIYNGISVHFFECKNILKYLEFYKKFYFYYNFGLLVWRITQGHVFISKLISQLTSMLHLTKNVKYEV